MKAFICSLITIFLLTAAVTVNGIYITNETSELAEMAERFPDNIDDHEDFMLAYADFTGKWEKFRGIVSLSVSNAEAESIDDTLKQLHSRFESGNSSDMAAAKVALIGKIKELRNTESFGLGIL